MPDARASRFGVDVRRWCEKAKGNADQVLRATVLGLTNNIVFRSPVGNPDLWKSPPPPGYVGGRFRANWQVTIGEPARDSLPVIDPTGSVSILSASTTMQGAQCGPPVYIVNNLPYAIELEYGHSTQSPEGMVRLASAEFQQIVNNAVRSLQQ